MEFVESLLLFRVQIEIPGNSQYGSILWSIEFEWDVLDCGLEQLHFRRPMHVNLTSWKLETYKVLFWMSLHSEPIWKYM